MPRENQRNLCSTRLQFLSAQEGKETTTGTSGPKTLTLHPGLSPYFDGKSCARASLRTSIGKSFRSALPHKHDDRPLQPSPVLFAPHRARCMMEKEKGEPEVLLAWHCPVREHCARRLSSRDWRRLGSMCYFSRIICLFLSRRPRGHHP